MLEYNNENDIIIQYEFKEPEILVNHVISTINRNVQDLYKVNFVKENKNVVSKYREIYLEDTNNIMIKVNALYENGMTILITCYPPSFGKTTDIPTEATLIVKKDGTIKFFISKIDNSYLENQNASLTSASGNQLVSYNEDIINKELNSLGKRIDINQATIEEDDNIFTKKKNEKIRTLVREKLRTIITNYAVKLSDFELSKIKK
ncbi:MAG: hypothetical protein IKN87_01720 [Bacilli bacterium]|nr:hypothetical protein [Bacilli bacterium]